MPETKRFGELKKSVGNVSQKVLTAQLRQMEENGLLIRTVYPEVPPRVAYTLTELGYSLKPIWCGIGGNYEANKKSAVLALNESMEMRGVEPLSESPSIAASPITVGHLCDPQNQVCLRCSLCRTMTDNLPVLVAS